MVEIIIQIGLGLWQGVIVIGLAPGMVGLLRFFKAGMQGRRRTWQNIRQPYADLWKLLHKPAVRSRTTSLIFAVAPVMVFSIYGALACMLPLFPFRSVQIDPDLVLILYLLGLARFIISLAGLDSGASLGGLGSSREMFFHFLTEIGMGTIIAALMLKWNTFYLTGILENFQKNSSHFFRPDSLLLAISLFLLILFEAERLPVDNPATHLELTMAHRAILLEYAGRDLALLEWAEMTKLFFLLGLWCSLFLPFTLSGSGLAFIGNTGLFLLEMIILTLAVAVWEMSRPKLRLRSVSGLSMWAIGLSVLAMIYAFAQSVSGV